MEIYTIAGAAREIGCTPNRLKNWMNRGFIPDHRIQFGKLRARVLDRGTIEKIRKVVVAIDRERMPLKTAFEKHFGQA